MSGGDGPYNGNGNGRAALADHLPPQNLDAERAVLGALLIGGRRFGDVLEVVDTQDFYRDAHQVVFAAMKTLYERGSVIDAVTVSEELTRREQYQQIGGDELLLKISQSVPHAANAVYHAEIVRQKSIVRGTIQVSKDTIRDGYSNLFTSEEVLNAAISRLSRLCDGEGVTEGGEIRDFPAPPGAAAFQGVMGEIVRMIDPYTEANLAAILMQLVVGFGNMVGSGPCWVHESNRHRLNLYLCLVGNTADGKKGTSWGYPRRILTSVDETWGDRIIPGINSGPALIEQIADEETTRTGSFLRGQLDKRLLMYESEFTRLLAIFSRDSETLGMVLRQAWEDDRLAAISKKNPVRATGAHISSVCHVTPKDLHDNLRLTDIANGLGNRFLWCCTKASKKLDSEVWFDWSLLDPMIAQLKLALQFARFDIANDPVPMGRSPTAQVYWLEQLEALRKPRPGLLGAILARGPAQVMRMAAIYAVVDRQRQIETVHLKAALELWAYCVRSIDFIFGERLGDPDAERLMAAIQATNGEGLSQTKIQREVFRNHKDAESLILLLRRMVRDGLIRRVKMTAPGASKPTWMWFLDTPGRGGFSEFANLLPENDGKPF